MKKVFGKLAALGTALCIAGTLVPLTACGLFGGGKVEVSTFEELVSEENDGKRMTLAADIDCGGAEIQSITPKTFDGQGHTIKNAVINASKYAEKGAGLFGRETEEVSNLNVEGFEVHGVFTGAIVKYGGECEITNVHVKDCTLEVKDGLYAGAVWAGYAEVNSNIFGTGGSATDPATITDCSAENVAVSVVSSKDYSEWGSDRDLYVGGVAGTNIKSGASGCHATGCTITGTSSHYVVTPYVGGLFGNIQAFTKCYSSDNTITGSAVVWGNKSYSAAEDTTPKIFVGGAVGLHSSGKVTECYTSGNTIGVKSAGTAYAGGFSGRSGYSQSTSSGEEFLVDCFTAGNTISASNFAKEANYCKDYRYLGGLVGYMQYGIVRSCFAYKNTVSDENYNDVRPEEESNLDVFRYGAFAGTASHGTFQNCAAWGASSIPAFDAFCEKVSSATDCYISSEKETPKNEAGCTILSAADWLGEGLKERLALTGEVWQFADGVTPSMAL